MNAMDGRLRWRGPTSRLLAVAAIVVGLPLMRGLSGSMAAASPAAGTVDVAAGHDVETGVPAEPAHVEAGAADASAESHLGLGLASLCLALLALGLAAARRTGGSRHLRRGTAPEPDRPAALPVMSRAPSLADQQVLRC